MKNIVFLLSFMYLFLGSFSLHVNAESKTFTASSTSQSLAVELTAAEEEAYHNIAEALLAVEETALFPADKMDSKRLGDIYRKVLADYPEIFYSSKISWYTDGRIVLPYTMPKEEIVSKKTALKEKAEAVLAETIQPGMSEFDKVKAVHDYLVLHAAYDYDNYLENTVPPLSYTTYGLLVDGVAVCDGYAKSMKLLLEKSGVETHYVTGLGNGGLHAWNVVNVDGVYYYIDATFDDPVPNRPGQISYKYFLVTEKQLSADHEWETNDFPPAVSTKYAYFQDFSSMTEEDGAYYYASQTDNIFMYKINKDGTGKTKLNNVRAQSLAVENGWIYFSNYSNGGYLSKMKTDGSSLEVLNSIHSTNVYIEGTRLYYTENPSGTLKSVPVSNIEDSLADYKAMPEKKDVPVDKVWTIRFNQPVKEDSAYSGIYIVNESGESMPIDITAGEKVISVSGIYEKNQTYYLVVKEVRSNGERLLKEPVYLKFTTVGNN